MATNTQKKRKQQQRQAAIRLVVLIGILLCVNMLAARFHFGLDLTSEQRFTLTSSTKKMLRNMKDVAVVEIYLSDDKLPAGLKRLKEATVERLESFKSYAGNHIIYHFVDPFAGKTAKEKEMIKQQLWDKGIKGVGLTIPGEEEAYSQKIIYPYALVIFNGKEQAVQLLENHAGMMPMDAVNMSETVLEYKFAKTIYDLEQPDRPRIAYMTGNAEPLSIGTYDALNTLGSMYHLDTVDLERSHHISQAYDAIIINKPAIPFDDPEKFVIDQYIMGGGHVLWMIDQLHTPMDSLATYGQFLTSDFGLNLDDILFKYGVRINTDLVEDHQCIGIPLVNKTGGMQMYPWIYFPVISATGNHPIVKNMPSILGKFMNTIDTIHNGINKTVLLSTSKYSRSVSSPARVSFSMVQYPIPMELFNKPYRPVAVLLDGQFKSVFENRITDNFKHIWTDSLKLKFRTKCDSSTSMIVVSDGDIIGNEYSADKGPMEMGYWKYSNDIFANKSFMLNCMEYFTDRSGLLEARSKELRLRLLDAARVKSEKLKEQIINIGVPIALVLIFASCYLFYRQRKYEKRDDVPAK